MTGKAAKAQIQMILFRAKTKEFFFRLFNDMPACQHSTKADFLLFHWHC